MSKLRSLAGQTIIYGVSSILGRVINYTLVPLHTYIFTQPEDLGKVTELYAYVAFLLVLYTCGMETTYFRFTSRDKEEIHYHYASTTVLAVSTFFTALILLNVHALAPALNVVGQEHLIRWLAIIIFIDAVTAIPFARLRMENKAKTFAYAKLGVIFINVLLQLFFLLGLPKLTSIAFFQWIHSLNLGIGYIFLANLVANLCLLPILWKSISMIRLRWSWTKLQPFYLYSLPILITGLAGMINEQMDKILLEHVLPDDFYADMNSSGALGVYGQTFKLSIFMMLAIQAFRFAGEPFFFSNAVDKQAPSLFARATYYFVLLSIIIFVAVTFNVDLIASIFLQNPQYRIALYLVPILLLGKLLWGFYVNISIWFKLTDRTIFGTYFTIAGAVVTLGGNLLLIPRLGYDGAAISTVICYFTMVILCYVYGQKYFPIPYNLKGMSLYLLVAVVLAYLSFRIAFEFWIDQLFNLGVTFLFTLTIYLLEKKDLQRKTD